VNLARHGVNTVLGVGAWMPRERVGAQDVRSLDPGLAPLVPAPYDRREYDLTIAHTSRRFAGLTRDFITINEQFPGPTLRFREGEEAVIRVHNRLREDTSIHWHGILLPTNMDGVPGLSFDGIRPNTTFEYRFPVRQAGTYWFHSHSTFQEQLGHYGSLVIEPAAAPEPRADREFVIVLSDWTPENPRRVLSRLKKQPDTYNFQRRTLRDFFRDLTRDGVNATLADRWMWGQMRMNPTDLSDVTGATYKFLLNGQTSETPWRGVYVPGERIRLRVINAAAATIYDVRIPGVPMSVIEVSGQPVTPVETDEFRIGMAETYDVLVTMPERGAHAIFAEAIDRSGFAVGALVTSDAEAAAWPARRRRPLLGMTDMGMVHDGMAGMSHEHAGHAPPPAPPAPETTKPVTPPPAIDPHAGHVMLPSAPTAAAVGTLRAPGTIPDETPHDRNRHGVGNQMIPTSTKSRLAEPGAGLGADGWRVLTYSQLTARDAQGEFRAPDREIEIHLTGNMERFMWSIVGVPYDASAPIDVRYGERVRLTMVNDTMMHHPMHLHGLWMELENGQGDRIPRVHTVNVKPAERMSLLFTADAIGRWAFHCHVLYHMEVGMFREFRVRA
jgi:CopA family copper-resistance protein